MKSNYFLRQLITDYKHKSYTTMCVDEKKNVFYNLWQNLDLGQER